MSGRASDDPEIRRLHNRLNTLEKQVNYLDESVRVLAEYVRAVEADTIAEPDLDDHVRDRARELAASVGQLEDENPTGDTHRLFDE